MTPDELEFLDNGLYAATMDFKYSGLQDVKVIRLGSYWHLINRDGTTQGYTLQEFADLVQDCTLIYDFESDRPKPKIYETDKIKVSLHHVRNSDGSGLYTVGHSKFNARHEWKVKPLKTFSDGSEDAALYAYYSLIFTGK